jgi:molybdopterin/thiamine biosynthesis adenylyltransferase
VPVVAGHGRVLIYVRPYERAELADPDGSTAELLQLLSEGTRTVGEIASELRSRGYGVQDHEVAAAVDALAELGVLHEGDEWSTVSEEVRARHESNLRYYELFSTPERGATDIHAAVARSRVLLLGVGGAGSGILQSLVGAGVSFVRLVDVDTVELKNLARQFCYRQADVGRYKVEAAVDWVRDYSAATTVEPLVERIGGSDRIGELAVDVDVVVCAIDTPDDVQLLVNDACMDLGVPFVTGGLQQSALYYWSVEPGVSPCRHCLELHRQDQLQTSESLLAGPPLLSAGRVNRGTGPVCRCCRG